MTGGRSIIVGHYKVARIQQGTVETEATLTVELHVHTPAALAVDSQIDGMPACPETRGLQQQVGQFRVDATSGQGLGVEGAGDVTRQYRPARQCAAQGQGQTGQYCACVAW